jgi:hypothetical protein
VLELLEEDADEVDEQVDEALGLMLSVETADDNAAVEKVAQTAASTALKMLTNLQANPTDPKLKYHPSNELPQMMMCHAHACTVCRSIRVNNAAFKSKVSGIPGGVELFICGGFESVDEDGEQFLRFPDQPSERDMLVLKRVIKRYNVGCNPGFE